MGATSRRMPSRKSDEKDNALLAAYLNLHAHFDAVCREAADIRLESVPLQHELARMASSFKIMRREVFERIGLGEDADPGRVKPRGPTR